ncbi:MAG TPA: hypothetical protein VI911_10830 [Patescibacteria group bacterium]|nr:hypothetical protein [Patescibacteria group bacterium]
MSSKYKTQIRHAKQRALERFDLQLNNDDYQKICKIIQTGKSKIIDKQSNRVSIHEVTWASKTMTVVYDKSRNTIVSFLPEVL